MPQVPTDIVDLIGNLRLVLLILDGAFIFVQHSEAQIHLRDLGIQRAVENAVSAADHGFVIFEGIPGEGEPRGDIAVVGIQRTILRVYFVADAVVQGEIGRYSSRSPAGRFPITGGCMRDSPLRRNPVDKPEALRGRLLAAN